MPKLHVLVALTGSRVVATIVDQHILVLELIQQSPGSRQVVAVKSICLRNKLSRDEKEARPVDTVFVKEEQMQGTNI